MDDFVWMFLRLPGGVLGFVALVGLFKLLAWWLSSHPRIARVFTVVFSGLGGAAVAGVAAILFTFLRYSFRGGTQIFGMDRAYGIVLDGVMRRNHP